MQQQGYYHYRPQAPPSSSSYNFPAVATAAAGTASATANATTRYKPLTTTAARKPLPRQQQQRKKIKCLVLGASNAGKTSIIRRYFYKRFDVGTRVPTLGADWHTTATRIKVPVPTTTTTTATTTTASESAGAATATPEDSALQQQENDAGNNQHVSDDGTIILPGQEEGEEIGINLQVWDTPGRERLDPKKMKHPHHHQQHHAGGESGGATSAADSDSPVVSFLRRADAVMLVYDMTSSTSFKQLLKWYADITALLGDDEGLSPPPCLVVANKLDMFVAGQQQREEEVVSMRRQRQERLQRQQQQAQQQQQQQQQQQYQRQTQPMRGVTFAMTQRQKQKQQQQQRTRRDVLGLGGSFRGNDYQYEYKVSKVADEKKGNRSAVGSTSNRARRNRHHPDDNEAMEFSSYLADRENWTTDDSYLTSLIITENESNPDRGKSVPARVWFSPPEILIPLLLTYFYFCAI